MSREGGRERRARAVALATGYFGNPKRLGVPGEDLPWVHSRYKEPYPLLRPGRGDRRRRQHGGRGGARPLAQRRARHPGAPGPARQAGGQVLAQAGHREPHRRRARSRARSSRRCSAFREERCGGPARRRGPRCCPPRPPSSCSATPRTSTSCAAAACEIDPETLVPVLRPRDLRVERARPLRRRHDPGRPRAPTDLHRELPRPRAAHRRSSETPPAELSRKLFPAGTRPKDQEVPP